MSGIGRDNDLEDDRFKNDWRARNPVVTTSLHCVQVRSHPSIITFNTYLFH